MQTFEISLKNEKLKFYQRLSWFIILILILIFSFNGLYYTRGKANLTSTFIFLASMGVALLLKLYFEKTKYRFGSFIFYFFLIAAFIVASSYILAGISLFFLILYSLAIRAKTVFVSTDNILYPSVPPRRISWNALQNCMLKDGMLTIDLRNNKIIQQLIDDKTSVNEKEFNEFCQEMLKSK